ncbi:hypothetical protein DCE93_08440 [Agromyces badenianii]|uniref:Uncharacterized protein n=1 Tax=Agromyces badenianii TaxID=2080742 RepID=A0A2S0WWM6_9MICO|nr:hypothetical protein [Agromyces badenianii]AWB95690.1 hypothetical protein DCE93_08440 [Agromyces badenianii]
MSLVHEFVELSTSDDGRPLRLVWRSRRFRVTDMPTTLVGPCDWWAPVARHDISTGRPPLQIAGWRFQASADDGETHVFDVRRHDDRWQLVRVFD